LTENSRPVEKMGRANNFARLESLKKKLMISQIRAIATLVYKSSSADLSALITFFYLQ